MLMFVVKVVPVDLASYVFFYVGLRDSPLDIAFCIFVLYLLGWSARLGHATKFIYFYY